MCPYSTKVSRRFSKQVDRAIEPEGSDSFVARFSCVRIGGHEHCSMAFWNFSLQSHGILENGFLRNTTQDTMRFSC